jgi:hypothetical protein
VATACGSGFGTEPIDAEAAATADEAKAAARAEDFDYARGNSDPPYGLQPPGAGQIGQDR